MAIDLPDISERIAQATDFWANRAEYTPRGGGKGEDLLMANIRRSLIGYAIGEEDTFRLIMTVFNPRLHPTDQWEPAQVRHKIRDVSRTPSEMELGVMLTRPELAGRRGPRQHTVKNQRIPQYVVGSGYSNGEHLWTTPLPLPDPIELPHIDFLLKLFGPDECVHFRPARMNAEGERKQDVGITKTVREWAKEAKLAGGNLLSAISSDAGAEWFFGINPMKPGGNKDEDVALFRYTLLEFDDYELGQQHNILMQSGIPIKALIYTGGKSLHAIIPVSATDRRDYDAKRLFIEEFFPPFKPDNKVRNPSRTSRLPNTKRGDKMVELLGLNIQSESFDQWRISKRIESCGREITIDDILEYNLEAQEETLVGDRYLEQGSGSMLFGPTGIGKSTLVMLQLACWAMGFDFFGITAKRPLRCVLVQSENSFSDVVETGRWLMNGIRRAHGIEPGSPRDKELRDMFRENFKILVNNSDTGMRWVDKMHFYIEQRKCDLLAADNLLSYCGCDVNDQESMSNFLRTQCAPMLTATKAHLQWIHHAGKPPRDAKGPRLLLSQLHYNSLGSSELNNWPRAISVLEPLKEGDAYVFRLVLSKRGFRARALDNAGKVTKEVFLKHGQIPDIWWYRADDAEAKAARNRRAEPPKTQPHELYEDSVWEEFLSQQWPKRDEIDRVQLQNRMTNYSVATGGQIISRSTCQRITEQLVRMQKLKIRTATRGKDFFSPVGFEPEPSLPGTEEEGSNPDWDVEGPNA